MFIASFSALHQPLCTAPTLNSSHVTNLCALRQPSIPHMSPASVHCTNLQFLTHHQPLCTAPTFSSSHVTSLCALHQSSIPHTSPAPVQYWPSISHMSAAFLHSTEWMHCAVLNLELLCLGQELEPKADHRWRVIRSDSIPHCGSSRAACL
jgi:hypothetical protein